MNKIIRLTAFIAMILLSSHTNIYSQDVPEAHYSTKTYSKGCYAIWEYMDYGYGAAFYQSTPKNYHWIDGQGVRVTENDNTVEIENIIIDLGDIPNKIVGEITTMESGLKDYVFRFPQIVEEYRIRERDENEKAYYRLTKYVYNSERNPNYFTVMCDDTTEMHLTEDSDGAFHMDCIDITSGESVEAWLCVADETGFIVDNEEMAIELHPYIPDITLLPENLEVKKWGMKRISDGSISEVFVAWDEEFLYLKGIFEGDNLYKKNYYNDHDYFIEGHEGSHWIKGKRDGNSVVFESGQYLGMDKFKYLCELNQGYYHLMDSGADWYNPILSVGNKPIVMEFKNDMITYTTPDSFNFLISGIEYYCGVCINSFNISPENTGIDVMTINSLEAEDSRRFDLMGREISDPKKGAVYIQNGKKYVGH